jgi:hypothetical protein
MKIETLSWTAKLGWAPRPPHGVASPDLILYFGPTKILAQPDGPVVELLAAHPQAVCAGCSTAGEIFAATVGDDSVSVALIKFASTQVRAAVLPVGQSSESEQAGVALARQLNAPDLRHVLVLSDGLGVNGTALTAGLRSALPKGVYVTGGLAGDGTSFKRTLTGVGRNLAPGQVVGIGFYGEKFSATWGSAGGWQPFGPKRLITRSANNVLFELDGQPALPIYKRYLGERAADLPATGLLFPLEVLPERDTDHGVVRTILAVDEAHQSLTFAGDMPAGSYARLMKAGSGALVAGAATAARGARSGPLQPGRLGAACGAGASGCRACGGLDREPVSGGESPGAPALSAVAQGACLVCADLLL